MPCFLLFSAHIWLFYPKCMLFSIFFSDFVFFVYCMPLTYPDPYFSSIINFDVIKQNELELANAVFKIQPNKTNSLFGFLLFVQSFNCLYLWNQLPNLCGGFTNIKPKQYPNRKCQKQNKKPTIIFLDFRLILLDGITIACCYSCIFGWFVVYWKLSFPRGGGGNLYFKFDITLV